MSFPARIERLSGKGIITVAAKHNLREIAAEIGVEKRIDPLRMRENYRLRGPATAKEVATLRKSLLMQAGIKRLRVDAVQGLEVLFTWPFPHMECPHQYFEDCTQWVHEHFQVPILSSVVHMDESKPHCHVLMLPLVNGRMNGSDLFGKSTRLAMHLRSFYDKVGSKYGIAHPSPAPRLSATAREFVISRVHSMLESLSGLTEQTIDVLLAAHRKNPSALMEHFKVSLPPKVPGKSNSFVAIMTRKVKAEKHAFPSPSLELAISNR